MGAGRTEVMRGIFGLDEIESGTLIVEGQEVKTLHLQRQSPMALAF